MPDFTFWDIVLMGLLLTIVQAGTHFVFEMIRKWFENRKNNTVCDLYLNDEFIGKQTFKECRETYDRTPYKGMKSSGYDKKAKRFHINVENR